MVSIKPSYLIIVLLLQGVCSLFINTTEVLIIYSRYCGHHRLCSPDVMGFPISVSFTQETFNQCPECYCDVACFNYGDCCIDKLIDTFRDASTSHSPDYRLNNRFSPNVWPLYRNKSSDIDNLNVTLQLSRNTDHVTNNTRPSASNSNPSAGINMSILQSSSTKSTDPYTEGNIQSTTSDKPLIETDSKMSDKYICLSRYVVTSKCSDAYLESIGNTKLDKDRTNILQKCEQKHEFTEDEVTQIPVFSNVSAVSYSNMYCAICNNDTEEIEAWIAKLSCKSKQNFGEYTTLNDFFRKSNKKCGSEMHFTPNDHQRISRSCNHFQNVEPDVKTCTLMGKITFKPLLDLACQFFNMPFMYEGLVFKNVFCYHCNTFPEKTQQGVPGVVEIVANQIALNQGINNRLLINKSSFIKSLQKSSKQTTTDAPDIHTDVNVPFEPSMNENLPNKAIHGAVLTKLTNSDAGNIVDYLGIKINGHFTNTDLTDLVPTETTHHDAGREFIYSTSKTVLQSNTPKITIDPHSFRYINTMMPTHMLTNKDKSEVYSNVSSGGESTNEYSSRPKSIHVSFPSSRLIDSCPVIHNPSLQYQRLSWACEHFIQFGWNALGVKFKNPFCCKCTPHQTEMCHEIDVDKDVTVGTERVRLMSSRSYRFLFDFTSIISEITSEYDEVGKRCPVGQFLDMYQDTCRDIVCSPGRMYVYDKDECLPIIGSGLILGYAFKNTYIFEGNTSYKRKDMKAITKQLTKVYLEVGLENVPPEKFEMRTTLTKAITITCDTKKSKDFLQKVMSHFEHVCLDEICGPTAFIHIEMNFILTESASRNEAEEMLMALQRRTLLLPHKWGNVTLTPTTSDYSVIAQVLETSIDSENKIFQLENDESEACINKYTINKGKKGSNSNVDEEMDYIEVHQLLICTQVVLETKEYIQINESFIKVQATGKEYGPLNYILLDNGAVKLCLRDYLKDEVVKKVSELSILEYGLDILTWTLTIISLLCLCLTFATYCIHDKLRTIPGKNNMFLVSVLFFAHVFLSIGLNGKWKMRECIIFGMLSHYFWICVFLCMNVCSLHMFRVFSGPILRSSYIQDRRVIWYYINYIFGTPLLVLTATVVTNLITTEGASLGYGHSICFLNGNTNVGIFFVLPVVCMIVLNLFYFMTAVCKIMKAPRIERNGRDSRDFFMYLKLFSLTGISWVLQILDSQFSILYLRILSIVINASQGLFIFLAFVCNQRVLGMYRELLHDIKASKTTSAPSDVCTVSTSASQKSPQVVLKQSKFKTTL